MIILITGPSGAGKTTLGNKIKDKYPHVVLVDSDEIHDNAFLELFNNNKKFKKMIFEDKGNPQKIHDKLAIQKRDEIIKKNKNKQIVFVGMTIPLDDIEHVGYFIDLPIDENYRRVNLRTLDDICDYATELKKLYKTSEPQYIDLLALFKFKIRHQFPIKYQFAQKNINNFKKDVEKKGYEVMTSDQILEDIGKLLNDKQAGYYDKYCKYKTKYIEQKKLSGSGDNSKHVIIHISGSQGSGKTTLGKILKEEHKEKIHMKDLDNLFADFANSDYKKDDYQIYIDDYISKHSDRPLIFVGLDAEMCLGEKSDRYYNLKATHKFYIDLPTNQILKQRFMRQVDKLHVRKEWFFDAWLKDPKVIQDKLLRYVDLENWIEEMKQCAEHYKNREYKFANLENITDEINKILSFGYFKLG